MFLNPLAQHPLIFLDGMAYPRPLLFGKITPYF